MSKHFASSQPEKQLNEKQRPIVEELMAELAHLRNMSDSEIDLSEMPEQIDWTGAAVGKYYRPVKEQLSIRLDADVVGWFKAQGKGYQSRMNQALRHYVQACIVVTKKSDSIASKRAPVPARSRTGPTIKSATTKRKSVKRNTKTRG
jgi:uncharacterized protein (DUF4415 family)